jgi:hypothetical protein
MGGLGLCRQKEYGDVADVSTNIVTDVYRDIMGWEEFRHPCEALEHLPDGTGQVELLWASSEDATGIEISGLGGVAELDLGAKYWRRVALASADGDETCVYCDAPHIQVPAETVSARVFALPPDGRNNTPDGYRATVPVPRTT